MKLPITRRGLARLTQEVEAQQARVKEVGAEVGAEAGPNCDWHDNFAFEDARRRLELESTRLRDLQQRLHSVQLAEVREQHKVVALGTTVRLLIGEREVEYTIAGIGEGDAPRGIVSADAPLVQAIMGLSEGDEFHFGGGSTSRHAEIIKILPPSYRYSLLDPD